MRGPFCIVGCRSVEICLRFMRPQFNQGRPVEDPSSSSDMFASPPTSHSELCLPGDHLNAPRYQTSPSALSSPENKQGKLYIPFCALILQPSSHFLRVSLTNTSWNMSTILRADRTFCGLRLEYILGLAGSRARGVLHNPTAMESSCSWLDCSLF